MYGWATKGHVQDPPVQDGPSYNMAFLGRFAAHYYPHHYLEVWDSETDPTGVESRQGVFSAEPLPDHLLADAPPGLLTPLSAASEPAMDVSPSTTPRARKLKSAASKVPTHVPSATTPKVRKVKPSQALQATWQASPFDWQALGNLEL